MYSINVLYAVIDLFSALVCLVALFCCRISMRRDRTVDRRIQRSIVVLISMSVLVLLSGSATHWLMGSPGQLISTTLMCFCSLSCFAFGILSIARLQIVAYYSKQERIHRLVRMISGLVLAGTILIVPLNLCTGIVIHVNEMNQISVGKWYDLMTVMETAVLLLTLILAAVEWKNQKNPARITLAGLLIPPSIAVLLSFMIPQGPPYHLLSLVITSMILIVITARHDAELLVRQEKELRESRERLLAAQLRPHFLYNVISAIMGIEDNPPETVTALGEFGQYLRENMSLLDTERCVPFRMELRHLKRFLYLTELRFGVEMSLDYELTVDTDFLVPPLVAQIPVENAIRHAGLTPETGRILLRTEEDAQSWRVIVEDNGCGFDVDHWRNTLRDEEPGRHVGLTNLSRRLELLCGGKLLVESTPGAGTRVTAIVPKDGEGERKDADPGG